MRAIFAVSATDPDVLERPLSPHLRRAGLALLVVGGLLLAGARVAGSDRLPEWVFPLLASGSALAAVGAALALLRGGQQLDRRRHVRRSWWSLLGLGHASETTLSGCDRVVVERHRGDSDSPTTYPVRLAGAGRDITLVCPTDGLEARRAGERLARFLALPLHDFSCGQAVVRQPGELDESLRSRLRRTGGPPSLTLTLANPVARVERTDEGWRVEWAGAGPTALAWLPLGAGLALAAVVTATVVASTGTRPLPSPIVPLVVLATLVASSLLAAGKVVRRTVVLAGPRRLRVERVMVLGREVVDIPADELEELTFVRPPVAPPGESPACGPVGCDARKTALDPAPAPPGAGPAAHSRWLGRLLGAGALAARSDRAEVVFGAGLPAEELVHVHALLLRALA